MKEINNLSAYVDNFDELTYPTQLYHDLVVDGLESENKIALMGAWKTGAIRLIDQSRDTQSPVVHIDTAGNQYLFTNRWKAGAPVGYTVWNDISDNQAFYRQRIPAKFTEEQPEIVTELVEKSGFGFIWAMFVLHCYYPTIYPLYDQHVYRAYKYLESDGKIIRTIAPNSWSEYVKYCYFFLNLLKKTGLTYWELDRGLWAFGKSIKHTKNFAKASLIKPDYYTSEPLLTMPATLEESWIYGTTLGGKGKMFHWRVDSKNDLHIRRHFTNAKSDMIDSLSADQVSKIVDYVAGQLGEVALSNSVSKLGKGTENEGIGRFMYDQLGLNITGAQSSSQLASIFVDAGIWKWNEKKRGITFQSITTDWQPAIQAYYQQQLTEIE